jgi:endonuclease YncB( thermonuclease family)
MLRIQWSVRSLFLLLVAGALSPLLAGDSMYGRVTEVRRANLVRLEDKFGGYDIRLVGIVIPQEGRIADRAAQFVKTLVLDKNARMRLERRGRDGVMIARLFTADPETGIKDVGAELVRAGFARKQEGYDYKYGELAAAERQARAEKRGLWGGQ